MNKVFICILIIVCFITNSSCTKSVVTQHIEFTDSNFINLYMEIYNDYEKFIGATVSLHGEIYISKNNGQKYCMVIRHAHGICTVHDYEVIGFEIDTSDLNLDICNNNWIYVKGTLDVYYDDEGYYLIIRDPYIEYMELHGCIDVY